MPKIGHRMTVRYLAMSGMSMCLSYIYVLLFLSLALDQSSPRPSSSPFGMPHSPSLIRSPYLFVKSPKEIGPAIVQRATAHSPVRYGGSRRIGSDDSAEAVRATCRTRTWLATAADQEWHVTE